jgi:hypothetical protein
LVRAGGAELIRRATLLQFLIAAIALSPFAKAQSFPFQLSIQDQNQNVTVIGNGATVTLNADAISQSVAITLIVTYNGTTIADLSVPQLSGSPTISLTTAALPQTLTPGASYPIGILFTPNSATTTGPPASAQLTIPYKESGTTGTNGTPGSSGAIALSLSGTAPNFVLAYEFQSNQNIIALTEGSTLPFPATPVATTSTATILVENIGNGRGQINSVQVTGAAFSLQGLALLPGAVASGSALQFMLVYAPQNAGANVGTLQVTFPDHTVTVNLAGTATASAFTYQLTEENGQSSTLVPGQAILLPPVAVGSSGTFSITVQNTGNGNGTINGASISGSSFQIVNPPAFPQTLAPGAFLTLNYMYTPPQSGAVTGLLAIGSATFPVTTTGSGNQLGYSYTIGSLTIPVTASLVTFSPVQVGQSSTVSFSIQNTGTSPASIVSIFANPGPFMLTGLPNQPLSLAAGASISFNIVFTPTAVGGANGALQINGQTINLTGSGNAPPVLPAYQFTGASGVETALQQPAIGLTLDAPYPLLITGTLTIVQVPDSFGTDPSVQFSTGGQTVAFSIPANATQAIFPNGASSIRLQTGSVSGTITIIPSFITSGDYSLTPANPATLQFTIPAAAPQLLDVQLSQTSAAGFTLQVIGIATSRTLSQLNFVFTPEPNYNLVGTTASIDVAASSALWFQSAASQPFGSQFIISVPFNLAVSNKNVLNSLIAIQSVSVTAVNSLGTSNLVSTQLQ